MPLIRSKTLQRAVGGSFLERWGIHAFSGVQLFVLGFHKDPAKIRMLRNVRRERRSLVNSAEQFLIHSIATSMRNREGDIAEVGVYAGSTAKMICEAKGEKRFHICDTFAGLPEPTDEDGGVEKKGSFACDLGSIQRFLRNYPNL